MQLKKKFIIILDYNAGCVDYYDFLDNCESGNQIRDILAKYNQDEISYMIADSLIINYNKK